MKYFFNPAQSVRILVFVLAALFITGCKEKKTPVETGGEIRYRDTLNIASQTQASTYDLHKISENSSKMIVEGYIIEKLAAIDKNGNTVPELAESWDISGDQQEFTFHLRKGIKFHDGTPFNADAVVSSMNRWIESFGNASDIAGSARFERVDDYTVRIRLPSPAAAFVDIIAGGGNPAGITTAAANTNVDSKGFWKDIIGTGPYRLKELVQQQYIVLERFEDYVPYGDPTVLNNGKAGYKAAKTKNIIFHYVSDAATRIAGLETGQFDAAFGVSTDDYERLVKNPDLTVIAASNGVATINFNKRQGLMTNVNLRQAVNYAIDCEALMRASYGEHFELDSSYMEKGQPWYSLAGEPYYNQKNPEKAREYLAKANYKNEPIRIIAANSTGLPVVLKQQLETVGFNIDYVIVNSVNVTRNDPAAWEIFTSSWVQHPVPPLKPWLAGDFAGWADDPVLQEYHRKFYAAKSTDEAKKIWDEAQLYCWKDYLPIISVGHQNNIYSWNKKLEGVIVKEGLFFWNAVIKE
jgi:peptide/nickel transport system substrate-binding protein